MLSLFSTPTPLPGSNNLFNTRADLLASFEAARLRVGQGDHAGAPLLDRFQVAGVVASWWNEIQYDLKTLAAQGFYGLMDDLLAGRVWVVWTTNDAKGTKHAKARHLSWPSPVSWPSCFEVRRGLSDLPLEIAPVSWYNISVIHP